jgi:hypothetical protein
VVRFHLLVDFVHFMNYRRGVSPACQPLPHPACRGAAAAERRPRRAVVALVVAGAVVPVLAMPVLTVPVLTMLLERIRS